MTDPYRSPPVPCPGCKTALRAFGKRLICDSCGGMQLDAADFFDAMATPDKTELVDQGATTLACPRCMELMRGCHLRVGDLYFDHLIGRCAEDGLWLAAPALEDIFTQVGRSGHRGSAEGRFYGGSGGYMFRYAPAHKPRPTPVPTSAFKDRLLPCPVCTNSRIAIVLDRWPCEQCGGTFVENEALLAMVGAMTGAPAELPAPSGVEGARSCPICTVGMQVESFEQVEIDRCPEHGVWFDPAELGTALRGASKIDEPRGLVGWLKRLF